MIVSPAKSNPFREAGNSPSNSNGRGSDRKNTGPAGGRGASKPQSKTPSTTATQKKTSKIKEKPTVTISPPLEITLLEQGETEAAEEPKWGTFCNHLDGEWIGQYAAYTPWEVSKYPIS